GACLAASDASPFGARLFRERDREGDRHSVVEWRAALARADATRVPPVRYDVARELPVDHPRFGLGRALDRDVLHFSDLAQAHPPPLGGADRQHAPRHRGIAGLADLRRYHVRAGDLALRHLRRAGAVAPGGGTSSPFELFAQRLIVALLVTI